MNHKSLPRPSGNEKNFLWVYYTLTWYMLIPQYTANAFASSSSYFVKNFPVSEIRTNGSSLISPKLDL